MSESKTTSLLKSALRGRLMLRLRVERFLFLILFAFAMMTLYIGMNIAIDSTLNAREKNRKVLENLQSIHTEMKCHLTSLDSVCQVEEMLENMGSELKIPEKQASKVGR